MNKTSCIIVEDEPLAEEKLRDFIFKVPWLELSATFHSGIEALGFLQQQTVQLIFLDIQMEGLTGIQMLESMNYRPQIILTTAYSNYAAKAFDLQVDDYLLKPYSFERFLQAVQKACGKDFVVPSKLSETRGYIFIKTDYRFIKILLANIIYIEGMRDYRCLVTKKSKILTLSTFTELSELLPSSEFIRVHKSYIVSLSHITSIEHQMIYTGDMIIPVSDTYKTLFYQSINFNIN